MCLAIPAKVLDIQDEIATVDMGGLKRQVSLLLQPDVQIGDYVIVHAGFVINRLDQEAAQETLKVLKEMASISEKNYNLD